MSTHILPAILTNDPNELRRQLRVVAEFTDWVHVDIMDGEYAPGTTVTLEDVAQANPGLSIEAHLMVARPKQYVAACVEHQFDRVLIHLRTLRELSAQRLFEQFPCPVGIVFDPDASLAAVEYYHQLVESVVVMGVPPGAQGQAFLPDTPTRVHEARSRCPDLPISVDGGVSTTTIIELRDAGASRFTVGSAVMRQPDPAAAFRQLHTLLESGNGTGTH